MNTSCIDIEDIFLKVGGFLLVSKIGIRAAEVIIEININGSKLPGLLKLSRNIPRQIGNAVPPLMGKAMIKYLVSNI